MARITVEDCVKKVESRFELVALAAQRAKSIAGGAPLTIEREGEKDTVISLREIAMDKITIDALREDVVQANQKLLDRDRITEGDEEEVTEKAAPAATPAAPNADSLMQEIEGVDPEGGVMEENKVDNAGELENLFAEENLDVDD